MKISYKMESIDSARFMAGLLSTFIDNLKDGINKIICKNCDFFFEYNRVNDNLKVLINKNYSNNINEKLKKRFKNTFRFSNNNIDRFILLLRKGVYPCEHMDEWEQFNETSLPETEDFYSNSNMEDITDLDYNHVITRWISRFVC